VTFEIFSRHILFRAHQVRTLIAALAEKIETSTAGLDAQAIGNGLFGTTSFRILLRSVWDRPDPHHTAHYNFKFVCVPLHVCSATTGLQRMKSNSAEVRALVQAISIKLVTLEVKMDSKGIGSALYGK
jgi:hypothetical protein